MCPLTLCDIAHLQILLPEDLPLYVIPAENTQKNKT